MTLRQLIEQLDELDDALLLYAEGGVHAGPDSTAVAACEPEDGSVPPGAEGMAYVLEVDGARDVVRVWQEWRDGRVPTTDDKCDAILHYARQDAFLPTEEDDE
jgi:hypothetical protein